MQPPSFVIVIVTIFELFQCTRVLENGYNIGRAKASSDVVLCLFIEPFTFARCAFIIICIAECHIDTRIDYNLIETILEHFSERRMASKYNIIIYIYSENPGH